ncbi:MAG: hypothetical protein ACI83P_001177 [Janthinobacterium sp.]|jgi:hypothetical protein
MTLLWVLSEIAAMVMLGNCLYLWFQRGVLAAG